MSITASDLDYALPPDLIAHRFQLQREEARMLVDMGPVGPSVDARVNDLPHFVGPGDVVVINKTQSRASRIRVGGLHGETEAIVIERHFQSEDWIVRFPPSYLVSTGDTFLILETNVELRVRGPEDESCWIVKVEPPGTDLDEVLEDHGAIPLPPYADLQEVDKERARTVFGSDRASAAPPTASLHLTQSLLDACSEAGATIVDLLLHVSLKTSRYQLVDPNEPKLHSEHYSVPRSTADACARSDRTIAIGTTVVRALETYASTGQLAGKTSIYLHRGYEFQLVDMLFTNFQAPRSTMLAMIDAFVGPRWKDLYSTAIEHQYRFLALGDACLLQGSNPRRIKL